MRTNTQNDFDETKPERVSQLRVRCDVRAGASDLTTCQMNLNKWRDRYNQAFSEARRRGCI